MMLGVPDRAFSALLRYWRGLRGLSQLDLAGAADISAKHVSFLETGRSKPSREMVLRLGNTLAVPLRDQNALLEAAGFRAAYREVEPAAFDDQIRRALRTMMQHQEPYPLLVMDRHFEILMANDATFRLLEMLLGPKARVERNALKLLFDPDLLRRFVVDWAAVARVLLLRLQRDILVRPGDAGLTQLLSELCRYPGVPADWREVDYETACEPTMSFRFESGGQQLGFLTTMTVFQAPQNVSLEELQIESYFPLDDATQALCEQLAHAAPAPARGDWFSP